MQKKMESVRVWDPLVRIGHWLLVIGFFTAYLTEDDFLTQHVWAGYTVGAVVLLRLLWGLVGTKHARFTDFVYSPRTTIRYLGDIVRNTARRYIGHNPAGGVMILALLASLIVTTASGLMVYAYEENAGPLKSWVQAPAVAASSAPSVEGHDASEEGERGFEEAEEFWEELHELFANITLLLVLLHIGGVVLASVSHRENLVKAMFTGRKRAE